MEKIFMKRIKLLLISSIISFLLLFLINIESVHATDWNKAQTSKEGIVDMMEVLPEYLQVNSTAENRDFHIKRNERSIGSGAQYYFYFEGGTLTVSMTTDGIFRIGNSTIGTSSGNASYPINLAGGTETTGVLPESQGGFGTSTPKYVRQNDGSSTTQLATNITIAGIGTDTATMNTNGVDISPTEKSYLDGVTSNIQTQIDAKLTKVNGVNTYIGSVTADGKSGTSSFSILPGSNITTTATLSAGGHLEVTVNSSGSISTFFSDITGSATTNTNFQANISESGKVLVGLSDVIKLPATTTAITGTSTVGRWYNLQQSSIATETPAYTQLLLHANNPGTTTFTDSSPNNYTVTAVDNTIGTTTAKLGSGGASLDGTGDYLSLPDSVNWYFDGDFTIDFWINFIALPTAGNSFSLYAQKNAGAGDQIFIRLTNTAGTLGYRFYAEDNSTPLVDFTKNTTLNTAQWYHIALVKTGNDYMVFQDGVQVGTTETDASALIDVAGIVQIGYEGGGDVNGVIDEFRISKGVARWTGTFTPSTTEYLTDIYNYCSLQYIPPGTTTPALQIVDDGTNTTNRYLIANVTSAIFGLDTSTTGTETVYKGYFDGAVRGTAFNIASTETIKENIKPIKIKPDHLDAEGIAKLNYFANNKIAWIVANGGSYTTVVGETGTGSITIVDTDRMESDYNNYIDLEWASDINQGAYVKNVQKTYEKGFWQMYNSVTPKSWNPIGNLNSIRKGFVVEEMPDVVWGEDKQSIDIGALVAYMALVQQALKADTVFALSTLKELITTGTVTQQNIDYVSDRLEVLTP